jgi:hypothetical protein
MIIEHTPEGLIRHIVFDPVPPELFEAMDANGVEYHNFPPIKTEEGTQNVECDPMLDYIVDGQITRRPAMDVPAAVELTVGETFTLAGLPDPIEVFLDDQVSELSGGTLELSADMPAEYRLILNKWPYQTAILKVTVNA